MELPANIKDEYIIIKYGLTDDIERRTKEHDKQYGSIKGVQLGLMSANAAFSYIDPKFLSEAETDIKDFFQTIEIPIAYKSSKELVAIDPKHEKQIARQYKYIGTEYQGNITDLVIQIKDLKRHIESMVETNNYKLQAKDHQVAMKDKDLVIKDKELETMNEKLKYESLQNDFFKLQLSQKHN